MVKKLKVFSRCFRKLETKAFGKTDNKFLDFDLFTQVDFKTSKD